MLLKKMIAVCACAAAALSAAAGTLSPRAGLWENALECRAEKRPKDAAAALGEIAAQCAAENAWSEYALAVEMRADAEAAPAGGNAPLERVRALSAALADAPSNAAQIFLEARLARAFAALADAPRPGTLRGNGDEERGRSARRRRGMVLRSAARRSGTPLRKRPRARRTAEENSLRRRRAETDFRRRSRAGTLRGKIRENRRRGKFRGGNFFAERRGDGGISDALRFHRARRRKILSRTRDGGVSAPRPRTEGAARKHRLFRRSSDVRRQRSRGRRRRERAPARASDSAFPHAFPRRRRGQVRARARRSRPPRVRVFLHRESDAGTAGRLRSRAEKIHRRFLVFSDFRRGLRAARRLPRRAGTRARSFRRCGQGRRRVREREERRRVQKHSRTAEAGNRFFGKRAGSLARLRADAVFRFREKRGTPASARRSRRLARLSEKRAQPPGEPFR